MARIVVTEVSIAGEGRVHVAGWSLDGGGMMRPLPGDALDWPAETAGPHLFQPGNIVTLMPAGRASGRDLPFRREDFVVAGEPQRVGEMAKDELVATLRPGLAAGVGEGFHGWLELGRFVRAGTDCPSLVGVEVDPRRFGFEERKRDRQLRAWIYDRRNQRFNLPVSARWMRQLHARQGARALDPLKEEAGTLVVRLGLADPLPDGRAYALVSNVIFA
jgi:hypothetical protein